MAQPELNVDFGLAYKVETTAGTWVTPTMALDAIRVASRPVIRWGFQFPGFREGVSVAGYGVPASANPLGRWARIDCEIELIGSNVAGTQPQWTRLLETFETHTDGVSENDFAPAASTKKTISVLLQDANKEYQVRGAVPERLVIRGPDAENRVMVAATIGGIMDVDPVQKAPDAQTFNNHAASPTPFQGAFTVGGTALAYDSFELDYQLQARIFRPDRTQTDGLLYGVVTQVNPIVRFPTEVVAIATHDPFTREKAPATALAYSQRLGSTAGNQWLLTGDHAEYVAGEGTLVDRESIIYYGLALRFAKPATGTWFRQRAD
ncbi:MAG: hypothetical protein ACE5JM_10490 [Armatimonadota bacterium]